MPTYSYACNACSHQFDAQQSFTDPALTVCPQCSGQLRKVYNSVGIVFKGSGFYRTDSRNDKKSGAAIAGGSSAKDSKTDTTAAKSTKESSTSTSSGGSTSGGSGSAGGSGSSGGAGTKTTTAAGAS